MLLRKGILSWLAFITPNFLSRVLTAIVNMQSINSKDFTNNLAKAMTITSIVAIGITSSSYSMKLSEKIIKASNVKKIHPISKKITDALSEIEVLKYVKIYNNRIMASNYLSKNGKKEPIVSVGKSNIVGVELLIDVPNKVIQFYSITSSIKGCGEMMVVSVVNTVPEEWQIVVFMDSSGGFWQAMAQKYPKLVVF